MIDSGARVFAVGGSGGSGGGTTLVGKQGLEAMTPADVVFTPGVESSGSGGNGSAFGGGAAGAGTNNCGGGGGGGGGGTIGFRYVTPPVATDSVRPTPIVI